MKVILTIRQRMDLMGLMPREANFLAMKMIRVVNEALSFSDAEFKNCEIVNTPDGRVQFNATKVKKAKKKEIIIPLTIVEMIRKALEKLDGENKIRAEHLEMYEMFIEKEPPTKVKTTKKARKRR